ncbi:hypothetical protein Cgig2_002864 [Carnegiea gigantea]|uniref:Reticulon-like protein n=1 Tax=Carnegiea gigantea TaxID=171969 RepID=A0A9Q1KQ87_9CARY|nr:hypothetical protein Cgig2_002864 [Carnegiea gigantea]
MVESHTFRRSSVHQALGAGSVADLLLWRKWYASALLLASTTSLWLLFEFAGYNPLSFAANVLLLLVTILFVWAKTATLLNRPLPPVPDLEVSDETVEKVADAIRVWVNRALSVGHEIAICGNLRVLVQVAALFWLISFIGNLCNFITFVYIGSLLALSIPVLYEKYQNRIDDHMSVVYKILDACYNAVLRRIPVSLHKKKKKTQ